MKEEAKNGEGNEWSKWKNKKHRKHRRERRRVAAMKRRNWTGAQRRKYEMGEWEYGRIR